MTPAHSRYVAALLGSLVLIAYGAPIAGAAVNDRGLQIGDGVLHPWYQLEPRYVVNPGRQTDTDVSDMALVNRLGLDFEFPSSLVELTLGAAGEYSWFPGLQSAGTNNLSDWGGRFDMGLIINRKGSVRFTFTENLSRVSDAINQSYGATLRRVNNRTGLDLVWKPGGGALELNLGYAFNLDLFSDSVADYDSAALNNMGHDITFRALWRFLPKTAFNLTIRETPTFYLNDGADFSNINSYPLNITVGMVGLITSRLSTTASAGYSDMLMAEGDASLRTGIGQLEFAYRMRSNAILKGGYVRSVHPVSFFRYYSRDRGYLKYDQQFTDQWQAGIGAGYSYLQFGPDMVTGTNRQDSVVEANLQISYRFMRYLQLQFVERLEFRTSPYTSPIGSEIGYIYNNLFLQIEARY